MCPIEECLAAREVLEVIPLVMSTVAAELRRTDQSIAPCHFRLLAVLAQGPRSLSQLAQEQEVSLPTMSSSVSKLVERGWVAKTRPSYNQRLVHLELTPAGHTVLDGIRHQVEAAIRRVLAPLSPMEQKTLLDGLAVLRNAFEVVAAGQRSESHGQRSER